MASQEIMDRTGICLLKKGYTVKSLAKSCFDIVARKGGRILLIKILMDANAISEEHSTQMQCLSRYIGASPLIIAEKAGSELQDNVVYSRIGVCTLNFETFRNCLEDRMPFIASTNAGLTAKIFGEKIRQRRDELGMSLAQLSKKIGVSRRMVARYENNDNISQITMSKAEKVYDIFGHEVFDKIDIFRGNLFHESEKHNETPITKKYSELGFEASEAIKVPFNVIARKEDELIITGVGDKINPDASLLSRLLDADNLVIFDRKKPKEKDIPSMTRQEFMEFEEAGELIRFLREF